MTRRPGRQTLQEVLTEAVRDFEEHGFDSQDRLQMWEERIREALLGEMRSTGKLDEDLKASLRATFERLVTRGGVMRSHQGIEPFRLQNVAARLHAELDRRILASAQLIKLNRDDMINKTMRRFSGWATSVPQGGSDQVDRREVKESVSKALRQLPFVERRVLIDQGHKLNSSISATLAHDGGAIAAKWFSHFRQAGYDYREDHKERDGKVYLLRDSWAKQRGLIKVGPDGWADEITQPAEEPFCRCKFVYLYHLRQLPNDMITAKGREALQRARAA